MASYQYRCADDGGFELSRPVGTAEASAACPSCGADSRRVFSAPVLAGRTPRAVTQAVERAERSAEAPDVVSGVPARRRARSVATNPAQARLPRP